MKKLILTAIFLIMTSVFSASAKAAPVIGNIYATDIKAYINGVEVPSYSIGGKTAVIAEDITSSISYSDELRSLLIFDLDPGHLIGGTNPYRGKPGDIIGNIYKTDIKTYLRGTEIPCYSLNGKMAIVIEDIALDNTFSDIGGKFIWDGENRTISLEFMYYNHAETHKLLDEKGLRLVLDDDLNASFEHSFSGAIAGMKKPAEKTIREVLYNGEVLGYMCNLDEVRIFEYEDGTKALGKHNQLGFFYYFDIDALKKAIEPISSYVPTYEEWMEHFELNMHQVIEEFKTDDYLFLYTYQPNTHGSSQFLIKLDLKTGLETYYSNEFPSVSLYGQKYFDNVKIDRENEKVYLSYDAQYVIDLKTDEIEKLD